MVRSIICLFVGNSTFIATNMVHSLLLILLMLLRYYFLAAFLWHNNTLPLWMTTAFIPLQAFVCLFLGACWCACAYKCASVFGIEPNLFSSLDFMLLLCPLKFYDYVQAVESPAKRAKRTKNIQRL